MSSLLLACALGALLAPQNPAAPDRLRIDGVVVGVDRQPVPNCEVWIGDDPPPRAHARTDATGGFALVTERRQFVAVHARLPGKAIGAAWVDGLAARSAFTRIELLPCRAVTGVVHDADGHGVAGAFVTAQPDDLTDLALAFAGTRTDGNGAYRLDEVVLGPVTVRACRLGVAAAKVDDDSSRNVVDLELDPDDPRRLDVELQGADAAQYARATAHVFAAHDAFAVPLPHELCEGRFDAAGNCSFVGMPEGASLYVDVDLPGAQLSPLQDFAPSHVRRWKCTFRVGAAPPPLCGRVVLDDGTPLAGATVLGVDAEATWQMQRPRRAVTARDGTFEMPAPVAAGGHATLSLLDDAHALATYGSEDSSGRIEVHCNGPAPHELTAVPTMRITARVVDAAGRPVACMCTAFIRDTPIVVAASDLDGRLRIVDRGYDAPREIRLGIGEPGGCGSWQFALSDREQDLGVLQLAPGATVRGRAVDGRGAPIPGARVWLIAFGTPMEAICMQIAGADGTFLYSGVLRGAYALTVARAGIALRADNVFNLDDGEKWEHDVRVQ